MGLRYRTGVPVVNTELADTNMLLSSFGIDEHGEVYLLDKRTGFIWQLVTL